jgi:hypothetical protein
MYIGPQLLKLNFKVWSQSISKIIESIEKSKSIEEIEYFCNITEFSSKSIKILLLYGIENIENNEDFLQYFELNLKYIINFLKLSKKKK